MKGKYLRRIGGLILATLMFAGIAFISPGPVQAQRRGRIIIVRPYPYRFYRPFGPWGYRGWGYDPWSPYGNMYRQYVFDNGDEARIRVTRMVSKLVRTTVKRVRASIQSALTTTMTLALVISLRFTDQVFREVIRKDTGPETSGRISTCCSTD